MTGTVTTRIGLDAPVSGQALSPSFVSAIVLSGSTSAISVTPSRTYASGTTMTAEQHDSSSVAATLAMPVMVPSSVAPLKNRTRTGAVPRPLRLPRTKTRTTVGRPATSGIRLSAVCTDCVR